jgi:hypothetical protein
MTVGCMLLLYILIINCGFLDEFMKEQLHQYNVGKRHLANMMGEDPDMFTQEDVDVSTADVKSSYVLYKD